MGETLIVTQVEIRFGTVVGDKHLAVLEGIHGAGIDIDVGIQLLKRYRQAPGFRARHRWRPRPTFPRDESTPPVTKIYLGDPLVDPFPKNGRVGHEKIIARPSECTRPPIFSVIRSPNCPNPARPGRLQWKQWGICSINSS
jgi:hypothetical protein